MKLTQIPSNLFTLVIGSFICAAHRMAYESLESPTFKESIKKVIQFKRK